MSRRTRKRAAATGGSWAVRILIGLLAMALLGAGGAFVAIRSYLHSDSFRAFLSQQVSRAARVDGRFSPFRWQGLAVDADAFEASGEGPVRSLKVEGLHTEVGVGGIRRGVWELRNSNIRRLDLTLATGRGDGRPVAEAASREAREAEPGHRGWLPSEVAVMGGEVQEIQLRARLAQGPLVLGGMRAKVVPGGPRGNYQVETRGGELRVPFPWVPGLRFKDTKFRWQDHQGFLHRANATVGSGGRLEMAGEWSPADRALALEGSVADLKCEEVFDEDWAKRLAGTLAGDFTFESRDGDKVARGQTGIHDGVLTALPVLDALAAYADTRRFRVLHLTEARSDWRWKRGEWFLSNLVLASEGLVRLEGGIRIRERELDGTFRLGLAPGTLARIPGAETHVFAPGERGLLWTPLRITGSLDDPKEDLSDRLIAAAGMRMFDVIPETGEKVVKFSRSVLGDDPGKAIGRGVEIIEEGAGIVRQAGGLLDGILGGTGAKPPPRPPEGD